MARLARIVVPNAPHHVTQRGNRRQQTFFSDADYRLYLDLLAEFCGAHGVEIWAYCLMPNHVHLILVPPAETSLARAVGEAHRRYSRHVNFRQGWRGFLWQGRFASAPMDDAHLAGAVRYVELNPVRARLAAKPEAWPWSSARAHIERRSDGIVAVEPLFQILRYERSRWRAFLAEGLEEEVADEFRRAERTGRPIGDAGFVARLEARTGRRIAVARPGPRRFA
jgi:putative transposase